MKGLGRARVYAADNEPDLLIEALAPVEGSDEFRAIAFRASRVDCVFGMTPEVSGILLNNGVTIPVALPFAELKRRIYANDFSTGDSIDLTLVSGPRVREVEQVTLAKKFNPAAEAPKPEEAAKKLEITLVVHGQAKDRQFRRVRFTDDMIDYFEPHAERKEAETFVQLKKGHAVEGMGAFYVALPITYFTYYLNKAKSEGGTTLDLADTTRPKDAGALKMQ